ncbi:response regulator [Glutamicibacter endophyticus]
MNPNQQPSASDTPAIRVLVVDDDAQTAAAHRDYVERVPGFTVAAVATSGQQALTLLADSGVDFDLVLLDMTLPDLHGIDVARRIRGLGLTIDIIAITAVRDVAVVRSAVATGITQYLIKPFSFAAFAEKLENHRSFSAALGTPRSDTDQRMVDSAFSALRSTPVASTLPKGLIPETLAQVLGRLSASTEAYSAAELAEELGQSRVTARRYLEYLTDTGQALKEPRHGSRGRPEYQYRARNN